MNTIATETVTEILKSNPVEAAMIERLGVQVIDQALPICENRVDVARMILLFAAVSGFAALEDTGKDEFMELAGGIFDHYAD